MREGKGSERQREQGSFPPQPLLRGYSTAGSTEAQRCSRLTLSSPISIHMLQSTCWLSELQLLSLSLNFFICKVEIIACILKVMVQMKDNVGKAPSAVLAPGWPAENGKWGIIVPTAWGEASLWQADTGHLCCWVEGGTGTLTTSLGDEHHECSLLQVILHSDCHPSAF